MPKSFVFVNLCFKMVNEEATKEPLSGLSLKGRILETLRREPGVSFSGESLAASLGVSRVAVWKQAKALLAAGYPLEVGAGGYVYQKTPPLSGGDDFLYPWEFGERESFFHHLASTDSTMNRAAELAAQGYPAGTVITAGEQTAGRGRNGHPWASRQGGLFFTLLERPRLCAADYFRVSLAFQIACARALTEICGKPVRLRWPNDFYAEGRKIAGLLTEFHAEGDRLSWISLGLGVNVNNAPHSREAANCAGLAGRPLSRQEVLLAILAEWEPLKKETASPSLHREWNALAACIGERALATSAATATAVTGGKGKRKTPKAPQGDPLASGTFMGIDRQGRGLIKGEKLFSFNPGGVSFSFQR